MIPRQGFTGVILELQAAEDALVSGDTAPVKRISHGQASLHEVPGRAARRSVRAVRPGGFEAQALPVVDTMVRK